MSYKERHYPIEKGDDTDGQWRWRGINGIDYTPRGLFIEKPGYEYTDEIKVGFDPKEHVGKPIQTIVVRYSTGNTFGRTNGEHQVIGAWLCGIDTEKIGAWVDGNADRNNTPIPMPNFSYPEWIGYFERFEDTEGYIFILKDTKCKQ